MSLFTAAWLTLLTTAATDSVQRPTLRETTEPYRIVAAAALPILPAELRPIFEARFEQLVAVATAELLQTAVEAAPTERTAEHFVLLDAAEPTADWPKRLAGVRTFPRDAAGAAKLCPEGSGASCGSLPWAILRTYASLQDGFRSRDAEAVSRQSGVLLHFVTDAALPFHVTIDIEGKSLGALSWSNQGAPLTDDRHRTLAWRCEPGVLRVLGDRLIYEVRVAPQRYTLISDPPTATFVLLGDTYEALQPLADADAEVMRSLGVTDAKSFAGSRDAYYERFAERAAPILGDRLEAAARLLAGLIGTAWEEAGRPALPSPMPTTPQRPSLEPPTGQTAVAFVGSRDSTVFHKGTCPHAKRVKPANLVRFPSAEAALAAGRTPCRACKPASP